MNPITMYRKSDGSEVVIYDFKYLNDKVYGISWSDESLKKTGSGWALLLMKNIVPSKDYLPKKESKKKPKNHITPLATPEIQKTKNKSLYEDLEREIEEDIQYHEKWLKSIGEEDDIL